MSEIEYSILYISFSSSSVLILFTPSDHQNQCHNQGVVFEHDRHSQMGAWQQWWQDTCHCGQYQVQYQELTSDTGVGISGHTETSGLHRNLPDLDMETQDFYKCQQKLSAECCYSGWLFEADLWLININFWLICHLMKPLPLVSRAYDGLMKAKSDSQTCFFL